MTDETGRIKYIDRERAEYVLRGRYSSHLNSANIEAAFSSDPKIVGGGEGLRILADLARADSFDASHGIRRIDTRDEAWVEKIARAIALCLDGNERWASSPAVQDWDAARAVLTALRGEG